MSRVLAFHSAPQRQSTVLLFLSRPAPCWKESCFSPAARAKHAGSRQTKQSPGAQSRLRPILEPILFISSSQVPPTSLLNSLASRLRSATNHGRPGAVLAVGGHPAHRIASLLRQLRFVCVYNGQNSLHAPLSRCLTVTVLLQSCLFVRPQIDPIDPIDPLRSLSSDLDHARTPRSLQQPGVSHLRLLLGR